MTSSVALLKNKLLSRPLSYEPRIIRPLLAHVFFLQYSSFIVHESCIPIQGCFDAKYMTNTVCVAAANARYMSARHCGEDNAKTRLGAKHANPTRGHTMLKVARHALTADVCWFQGNCKDNSFNNKLTRSWNRPKLAPYIKSLIRIYGTIITFVNVWLIEFTTSIGPWPSNIYSGKWRCGSLSKRGISQAINVAPSYNRRVTSLW